MKTHDSRARSCGDLSFYNEVVLNVQTDERLCARSTVPRIETKPSGGTLLQREFRTRFFAAKALICRSATWARNRNSPAFFEKGSFNEHCQHKESQMRGCCIVGWFNMHRMLQSMPSRISGCMVHPGSSSSLRAARREVRLASDRWSVGLNETANERRGLSICHSGQSGCISSQIIADHKVWSRRAMDRGQSRPFLFSSEA